MEDKKQSVPSEETTEQQSSRPSGDGKQPKSATVGIQVLLREFIKDPVAMGATIILAAIILGVFIGAFFIDQKQLMSIDVLSRYLGYGEEGHIFGTDEGGRDVFGQLIIGTRNSLFIGFSITIITSIMGIVYGLISGYFGGITDIIMMRIVDFFMILPTTMIIIVLVVIIPKYNALSFVIIMSCFNWVGKARLMRSRVLTEAALDYVAASKTLGTSDLKIMFDGVLPNISSLIIVNLTLSFAGNVGIETGLSYLGFGLPPNVPSLGTLIGYATTADLIENKHWVWLPAALLILVIMLCINYIGQAMQRVADARQRIG